MGRSSAAPRALRHYNTEWMIAEEQTGPGVSLYIVSTDIADVQGGEYETEYVTFIIGRSGLPFRCMRWTYSPKDELPDSSFFARGIELTESIHAYDVQRRVPLSPEPIGTALNILTVAGSIFMVRGLVVLTRVLCQRVVLARRVRESQCTRCAYPIERRVDRCPECGEPYATAATSESKNA